MGCPDKYYKEVLISFLASMNIDTFELENDEEVLEREVMLCKEIMSEKEFYYTAGRVNSAVFYEAVENDGCDGMNACIGGLFSFEALIGISEE